jgi:hypothetical protein
MELSLSLAPSSFAPFELFSTLRVVQQKQKISLALV